jgi:hypothetical protein
MKLVGGICGDIYSIAGVGKGLGASESEIQFAFEEHKRLLKVVPVRRRASPGRDMHIDQTKPPIGVVASKQNGVCVADYSDMRNVLTVSIRDGKHPAQIIGGNLRTCL